MQPAVTVDKICKRFRIGVQEERHDTLLGKWLHFAKKPTRNLSRLKSLTSFKENNAVDKSILWALKDISFQIQPGEVVGLIGLNGAGKSTLLKILSKITSPTSGSAIINGRIASLLEVGTGFHPELTGRENIYLNGTLLGMTKKEVDDKLGTIVEFSELEKFVDTPVKRYSSGMRVRLGFSVAAHLEPEILLIDEVLAVGDITFQRKCLGKMDEVSEQGRTIIFVSHNMEMIQRLCPRTILLKDGQKVMDDETKQVVDQYFNQPIFRQHDNANLEAAPRYKHYGRDFRFQKCFILNSKGERTKNLLLGEPFCIYIQGIAYKDFENIDYAIEILSYNRILITTFFMSEQNKFLVFKRNQPLSIQFNYTELNLNTGNFIVRLTALYQKSGIDMIPSAATFSVSDLNFDNSYSFIPSHGLVRSRPRVCNETLNGPNE